MIKKLRKLIDRIEVGELSFEEFYYFVKIIKELDLLYDEETEVDELNHEDYME